MRTLLIGAGYWGINYIRELAHNLVGVVETNQERANYVRNHYNVPIFPSLPDDLDYDAAIVATPPNVHIEVAYEIAKQGKYILIEKPMASSMEEAFKLRPYRDKIMVGHIYLYHPEVERLRQVYQTTPIEHIFTRRTNSGPVRDWQNALWDLAPHDISICNYILGQEPIGVTVQGNRDWAVLFLNYVACSTISYVSWLGNPKTRRVELVPADYNQERVIFDDLKIVLNRSPMRLMLDDFLSGSWKDGCTYDAGLEVINILEKCVI